MKKSPACVGAVIALWATGCVVNEAFLQAPFPRPTRTHVRGRGQRGQEMLTPGVVGIERAVRHVRQVSGEGYGLAARRGTLRTKTLAGAIATTTAVTASRRSEGGEEEALHERQAGAINSITDSNGGSFVETAGSRRLARRFALSSVTSGAAVAAAAAVATAVQASSLSLVFLLAVSSTTEDDIMSAMRGLDASLSSSGAGAAAEASRGKPTLTLPATEKGGAGIPSGGSSSGAIGTGTAQGGGGEIMEGGLRRGGGVGSGGETDLMRSMGGGARQAGPLTHGF